MVSLLLAGAGIAAPAERTNAPGQQGAQVYPIASDSRVGGDDALTRFVMDFSKKLELRAFTLADPYRVVIDLPQVAFNLPPKTGEVGRGLVKAFRFGLVMQGGSRIVMDVSKPVRIDKAFVVDAVAGQPARLVVDLAATDRDSFMKTITAENRPVRAVTTGALEHDSQHKGDPRPIVVIDPGHGGIDNGAVAGSGVLEKDIVLQFATQLRDELERSGKYRVV